MDMGHFPIFQLEASTGSTQPLDEQVEICCYKFNAPSPVSWTSVA